MCAKKCFLTDKKVIFGKNVSHSNKSINRRFNVNLQKKKIYIPELNGYVKVLVSAAGLRNINKKGLF